jgi:hypothetical protein
MDQERNLGVTEARFGLTLLICLLVAIGYIVLLRLGNSGELPVEIRTGNESAERIAREESKPDSSDRPHVLPIEPDGTSVPYTSQRSAPQTPSVQWRSTNDPGDPQRR